MTDGRDISRCSVPLGEFRLTDRNSGRFMGGIDGGRGGGGSRWGGDGRGRRLPQEVYACRWCKCWMEAGWGSRQAMGGSTRLLRCAVAWASDAMPGHPEIWGLGFPCLLPGIGYGLRFVGGCIMFRAWGTSIGLVAHMSEACEANGGMRFGNMYPPSRPCHWSCDGPWSIYVCSDKWVCGGGWAGGVWSHS